MQDPERLAATITPEPRAIVHAAISRSADGTILSVHGPSGPMTALWAQMGDKQIVLPSRTFYGVSPDADHYIAWDGEQYLLLPTLDSILADKNLILVGHAEPMGQTAKASRAKRARGSQRGNRVLPNQSERNRREKLLTAYKAATGNPSNKQIYEARNSQIYKPEFYAWVNGTLPGDSATCQNFERFLAAQKPPIPRKSKA